MKNKSCCIVITILLLGFYSVSAQMVDTAATIETKNLYKNLQTSLQKGIIFGHQDDMAYGVQWKYKEGRSDVKDVTGEYPGIFGWELGRIEIDAPVNLDSVPFDKMKRYICKGYENGAIITISWHLNNPLTGKSAWDPSPTNTVSSVLPGGEKNALYKSWLDKVALFIKSLKGKNGEYIPVIFRPFHELNGSWFWWGGKNCTPGELIQLWKFTVSYLRDTKDIHQLLYAYNTDRFSTREEYLQRYPGNDWVDIVGFDIYQKGDILSNDKFITEMNKSLSLLEEIARSENKIPALTEFGFNTIPDSTWWTNVFLKALDNHKIAYALAWRNAGRKSATDTEYYVPYKGQVSEADFKKFSSEKNLFFENKTREQNLYQ